MIIDVELYVLLFVNFTEFFNIREYSQILVRRLLRRMLSTILNLRMRTKINSAEI